MTEFDLMRALGDIDGKYIKNIDVFYKTGPSWRYFMKKSVKAIAAAAVFVLLIGVFLFAGQIDQPNTARQPENKSAALQSGGPVTVCVDNYWASQIKDLAECVKALEGENCPVFRWKLLPEDKSSRSLKLESLRVEIMSGQGPDLFLCFDSSDTESLFLLPEKSMRGRLFYPMDDLIEGASHFSAEDLHPALLEAGKTEEGQMLLPLRYTFSMAELEQAPQGLQSWKDIAASTDPKVRSAFGSLLVNDFPYTFSTLADYEAESLSVSQEELAAHLKAGRNLQEDRSETAAYIGQVNDSFLRMATGVLSPLYNDQGGVTAQVTMYAAINANSANAQGSFLLLDYLLSDELISGKGFATGRFIDQMTEKAKEVFSCADFYKTMEGISAKVKAPADVSAQLSPENEESLKKAMENITAVNYNSIWRQMIAEEFWNAASDSEIEKQADRLYKKMKQLLAES